MKWEDDVIKTKDESEPKSNNKCSLVWEVKNNYKSVINCICVKHSHFISGYV